MSYIDYMHLMIGDILMATYDDGEKVTTFPVVVEGIDENGTLVDGDCHIPWKPLLPEHKDMEYADELELIPLTAEILKANGFRYVNENSAYTLMVMSDDGYTIEVYICIANCVFNVEHNYTLNKECVMDRTHKCGYFVHELQHALRLCGLNDIADKFKVTD